MLQIMKSRRKILLVSYFFPPLGGAGSIRMTKFVKYLPGFGWEPVILTPRFPEPHHIDRSLLEEIPVGTTVIRTLSFEPTKWSGKKGFSIAVPSHLKTGISESLRSRIMRRIVYLIDNFCFVPDSRIGWLPFAVFRGTQVVRSEKIPVILATGGPWTDLLIGLFIHFLTGIPLVSDFRDPWTLLLKEDPKPRLRKQAEDMLEYLVFKHSRLVILNTDTARDGFVRKYHQLDPHKMIVLPNGYDEADFSCLYRVDQDKFLITHTGSFSSFRKASSFLKGIAKALSFRPEIEKDLLVNFLGTVELSDLKLIRNLGLEKSVKIIPHTAHREIPGYLLRSTILLLALPNTDMSRLCVPSKIYEYLRARVPILAIIPDGCLTADIIRKANAGIIVNPDNISEVAWKIVELYDSFKKRKAYYLRNEDFITQFQRKAQARKLSSYLNNVTK
ncbi:MAG: glycosyltransferase family 4 protein [Thermodesulfobacteriota bacterium]|nr:glycosyltransferase family 4 protein [Thermodesulfobacteriota bacterium]